MIIVGYTSQFLRQLKKLDLSLQDEVWHRVQMFKEDSRNARLKAHKLHGNLDGQLAFSVNYRYRIIFEFLSNGHAVLLAVDDHDMYKK